MNNPNPSSIYLFVLYISRDFSNVNVKQSGTNKNYMEPLFAAFTDELKTFCFCFCFCFFYSLRVLIVRFAI